MIEKKLVKIVKDIKMKKVILATLVPFFILEVNACTVENLTTKKQVEDAQKCMIERLEALDKHFKTYDIYTGKVKEKHLKLIKEEGICLKISVMYKETGINEKDYKNCRSLYKMRLKDFTNVSEQWQRLSEKIDKTKTQKDAIELKKDLLESTYDLILKRNNQ